MKKQYKNCVLRFFNKPPKLLIAKEDYINKLVAKDPDVLMVMYAPTEKEALETVKIAAKNWGGVYTT